MRSILGEAFLALLLKTFSQSETVGRDVSCFFAMLFLEMGSAARR
jgi:hypothetical protein